MVALDALQSSQERICLIADRLTQNNNHNVFYPVVYTLSLELSQSPNTFNIFSVMLNAELSITDSVYKSNITDGQCYASI